MARPVTHNTQFDPNTKWIWEVEFYDDDSVATDVTGYSFSFVLKNSSGSPVWTINNVDFTRPKNYSVRFEKSQAVINALPTGVYSYSFKVTNADVIDDEWVYGKIIR